MTLQRPPKPLMNVGFSGFGTRRKRWDDGIPWIEFPDGKWLNLRFFGHPERIVQKVATHWLVTLKNKKRFPMLCLNFNSETGEYENRGCPICEDLDPMNSEIKEIKDAAPRLSGYSHVIVRDLQRARGMNPDMKPWRPIRIPISVMIALQKLRDRNIHNIDGEEYTADVADPYYGRDVSIQYDSQGANPQSKYSIDKGDHTPLTDEEMSYIDEIYNFGQMIEYPSIQDMKKALTQNGYYTFLNGNGGDGTQIETPTPSAPPGPSFSKEVPPPPTAATPAPSTKPAPKPISGGMDVGKAGREEAEAGCLPEDQIPFSPGTVPAAPVAHGNAAVKAKPVEEGSSDLQSKIDKYSQELSRATPLKVCDTGELANLNVMACYGYYKGDMHCVRCPIRKYCLDT